MKVAIYARYSSENQSAKSIDDQIRVCKDYAGKNNFLAEDEHIYIDEAISGSIVDRPGLQALEKAAENKEFDTVIVDDLSRISRSNHQMLTLILKFKPYYVTPIKTKTLALLDEKNKSSNWFQWRGRWDFPGFAYAHRDFLNRYIMVSQNPRSPA